MRRAVTVAIVLAGVAACVRIPPVRLLPNTIRAIYVPTFRNVSYEPGLDEKITRLTQEEFLMDGRLDVVRPNQADCVLVGTLERFDVSPSRFARDDFPLTSHITAVAAVSLHDPSDTRRQNPLMTWSDINVEYYVISDARRIIEVIPEDAYEDALKLLAKQIVRTVITRPPTERAEALAPGAPLTPAPPRRVLGREKVDTRLQDIRSSEPLPVDDSAKRKVQSEP